MNHSMIAYHIQHNADQTALNYLEDVWVEKDPLEHRCFTIEFVCFTLSQGYAIWIDRRYSTSKKINFSRTGF